MYGGLTIALSTSLDPQTWELLQRQFTSRTDDTAIHDIYDGAAYKKHAAFLENPTNISFTMNTDGVALYHSSQISIWPVWLVACT